jgi:RimJ/RimL family protein N-acetyltransferase
MARRARRLKGRPRGPTVATPRLRTPRLDLGPLQPADADALVRVLADPALYTFTGGEPPSLAGLRDRFARLAVGGSSDGTEIWHNWVVRRIGDGAAVGTVQATIADGAPTAEIAWVVGVPWQGLGYASEAAEALVSWLREMGITTITAHIHSDHVASAVVASRAGLRPTNEMEDGERVWLMAPSPRRRPAGGPCATGTRRAR